MKERHVFTMSGPTVDLLRPLISCLARSQEGQVAIDLINLAEGLAAPDGMEITFDFSEG